MKSDCIFEILHSTFVQDDRGGGGKNFLCHFCQKRFVPNCKFCVRINGRCEWKTLDTEGGKEYNEQAVKGKCFTVEVSADDRRNPVPNHAVRFLR